MESHGLRSFAHRYRSFPLRGVAFEGRTSRRALSTSRRYGTQVSQLAATERSLRGAFVAMGLSGMRVDLVTLSLTASQKGSASCKHDLTRVIPGWSLQISRTMSEPMPIRLTSWETQSSSM